MEGMNSSRPFEGLDGHPRPLHFARLGEKLVVGLGQGGRLHNRKPEVLVHPELDALHLVVVVEACGKQQVVELERCFGMASWKCPHYLGIVEDFCIVARRIRRCQRWKDEGHGSSQPKGWQARTGLCLW